MVYSDFKSYIQANYADLLHRKISKFVNEKHDGLGFHSLNVLSLCDQKVENIEVKSLRCNDAPGPLVKIDVNVTADIVTKGLGTREYEAGRVSKWFTVHIEAFLRDKLEILDEETWTEEYNPTKFDKLTALDEFLIPYIYAEDLEDEADNFFETYCVDAIYIMGWMLPLDHILREMRITYYEAPLPQNVFGRMYFKEAEAEYYYQLPGWGHIPPSKELKLGKIKPGTMLISDDSHFMFDDDTGLTTIAHEIVHWDKHQKFFKILSLLNGDETNLSCEVTPEVHPDHLEGLQKAIWWAEWQANALAPRILMPRNLFIGLMAQIYEEQSCIPYKNSAEVMERTIDKISKCFSVSKCAAKVRALQLGYKTAEGVWINVDRHYYEPFTFNVDALGDYETFILDRKNYQNLLDSNPEFARLVISGAFIYIGCVVVINDPLYVKESDFYDIGLELTHYAREHVDLCCLKFKRNYSANMETGDFYNLCYLSRDVNAAEFKETKTIDLSTNQDVLEQQRNLDAINKEGARVMAILRTLPTGFAETFSAHMARVKDEEGKKMTYKVMHQRTGLSEKYISEISKGKKKPSLDVVYALCVGLHLHPIFSNDMIRKSYGHYPYDEYGAMAEYLLGHHFMESLDLINDRLKQVGHPIWGKDIEEVDDE